MGRDWAAVSRHSCEELWWSIAHAHIASTRTKILHITQDASMAMAKNTRRLLVQLSNTLMEKTKELQEEESDDSEEPQDDLDESPKGRPRQ